MVGREEGRRWVGVKVGRKEDGVLLVGYTRSCNDRSVTMSSYAVTGLL